jgi:hypothetical protein
VLPLDEGKGAKFPLILVIFRHCRLSHFN